MGLEPYYLDRRELALNAILDREDCNPCMVISAHDLDAEPRLLLSIIGRILFPKTGRFEFISERDLALMYHILNTISFDMASMMLSHIGASTGQNRFSLPYGMVFTLIFRHYGLTIPDTESTIKLRHTDYYSESTLHRMGFLKKDGEWVKKSSSLSHDPSTDIPATDLPGKSSKASEHHSPISSPSHYDDVPTGLESTPAPPQAVQPPLSTDQIDILSSSILNALTPRLDDLQRQNVELQNQNQELRNEYLTQMQELKNQNLALQIQITSLQATPSSSSSTSASLSPDTIKDIAKAVLAEVKGKFDELLRPIMKISEGIEELEVTIDNLRKKLNKEAETLLKHVWDISLKVQNEQKDYGIDGIAKELGMFKAKIDDAVQGIGLLMHDLKTDSSKDLLALISKISQLTKEISKQFRIKNA